MFYYLLHNSSFNKKGELKDRLITTLIYGSVIYIIIHAILSFSNKKNFISYFWFLFVLDCTVFMISNDFNFYTTSMSTLNVEPKKKIKPKVNILEQEVSDMELSETEDVINNYINKKGKVRFNEKKNEIREFKKEEPTKKVGNNKKRKKTINTNNKNNTNNENNTEKINKTKSTNIKKILKERKENNTDNIHNNNDNLALDELNLTLENLDLETREYGNSSSINEIQHNFLKKKIEDEVSDPGSDIDLEQFENSIIND